MIARLLQSRQASLSQRAIADPAERRMLAVWNDRRRGACPPAVCAVRWPQQARRVERIRQLTQEKERLERQLADTLPDFARDQGLKRPLPRRAAQGIARWAGPAGPRSIHPPRAGPHIKGTPAAVHAELRGLSCWPRGVPVRRVDLGAAAPINSAVQQWCAAIVERHGRARPPCTLRRLVWDPLSRHLPAGQTPCSIAPDGLLHGGPLAALPGDRPGLPPGTATPWPWFPTPRSSSIS